MPLTHDTTHVEDGAALFIDQYKDKTLLAALLASFTQRVQEFEDAIWDVFQKRLIDNAQNAQLDVIGKVVGQVRIGPDDTAYRIFIRTRIRANRSRGRADDVIAVTSLALNGIAFEYDEYYPASFVVDVLDPLPTYAVFVHSVIQASKPLGVGFSLHLSPDIAEANTFAFADGAGASEQDDANRGFSHTDENGAGGSLVGAI